MTTILVIACIAGLLNIGFEIYFKHWVGAVGWFVASGYMLLDLIGRLK